ncbi:TonB-dependent receptor [Methylogaea oryzae]|uniref:TonB-dependent receptor n=2 Tax=Methylogaea oryzae TaxID=1295382 RepID=A0A8D4VNL4_9GAMM|nr:TonB-dependent receptor [Methylogaea oryzae]
MLGGAIPFCVAVSAIADDTQVQSGDPAKEKKLEKVVVTAPAIAPKKTLNTVEMGEAAIAAKRSYTSDTAALFDDVPGLSRYGGGGVSSLPVIHGLNDDRVKVQVNGMTVASACANHMNPPLSYVDLRNIGKTQVLSGITPVSLGGDSIGGTIIVDSPEPVFAKQGEGVHTGGSVSSFYRSNGNGFGGSLNAEAATENLSIAYNGSHTQSGNYKAGDGMEVKSTRYENQNHAVTLAARSDDHLLVLNGGQQHMPYQGFPNARMDMTNNDSTFGNVGYKGRYDWGNLEAKFHYEHTQHTMNFLDDKRYTPGSNIPNEMPMYTDGKNLGYLVKAEIPLNERDILRVGNEYQRNELNDWWPPVAGNMMMGPGTFRNINKGERDRIGTFAEWDARWSDEWSSLLGLRHDHVSMDTGPVVPYDTRAGRHIPGNISANAFNAKDHSRDDDNFDVTALLRYTPDATSQFEAGYARKSRSPNLYERYAWSKGQMAMYMNGWFGDGNGYVGNVNLKPENAHTLSVTAGWHDEAKQEWEFKVTPYYTYVENYIDVDRCPVTAGTDCGAANLTKTNDFVFLQFANHAAQLYGVDVSGKLPIAKTDFGRFTAKGILGYVRGENLDTGDNLYHMMPVNAKATLDHQWGDWSNAVEFQLVAPKSVVTKVRNETQTAGYGLLNVRTGYEWKQVRVDAGVENVLDKNYDLPLGGAYLGARPYAYGANVPGMGRSAYVGVTVKF